MLYYVKHGMGLRGVTYFAANSVSPNKSQVVYIWLSVACTNNGVFLFLFHFVFPVFICEIDTLFVLLLVTAVSIQIMVV